MEEKVTTKVIGAKQRWAPGLHNAVSPHGVAACRAVLAKHTEGDPGAHGDGDTGANANRVAGMGSWQRQATKAWQGKAMQTSNCSTTGRHAKLAGLWSRSVRWCRPLRKRARPYPTVSPQPIAFACLCPYPLP